MRVRSRTGCVWALALLLTGGLGRAEAEPIMPLNEVKVGMKGHGRTVFQGSDIESFDVTVIGLLEGFDFEMDMILIRIDSGPVVTRNWGIIGGMSGSPIYIDGKMIGALAYGWEFQKEPIAGVTPIEQMLLQYNPSHPEARAARVRRELRERAREEREAQQAGLPWRPEGELRPVGGTMNLGGRQVSDVVVAPNRGAATRLSQRRPEAAILTPVATPVYVRGLGGPALRVLERVLEPYNLVPMQVGGAKVPENVPVEFAPGAAVAVSLTYGDIEMTGIGTLTWREGDTILAFGHPMFGLGQVDLPMSTGYVQAVIASALSSNKLGGAVKRIGRISQDRPTCIGGEIGPAADVLPIRYRLIDKVREVERDFDVKLMRQPGLTDLYTVVMMQMAMQNVAGGYFDGVTSTRVKIDTRVKEEGKPLSVVRNNSFDSKALSSFGINPLWDLFMTLTMLRQNPWGEAGVESVEVDLVFEAARRFANIERAQAAKQAVRPGERFDVTLYLRPYGGEPEPLTIPVQVPENAPLGPVLVVLIGGNDAFALRPRINPGPTPHDVPSLVDWLNDSVRNDSVVVEVVLPTTGLEMGGQQLPDLPTPYLEPLFTSTADGMRTFRDIDETVVPLPDVVAGVAAVMVEVVGEDGRRQKGEAGAEGLTPPTVEVTPPPMMGGEMSMAAEQTLQRLVGEDLPGPELSWALRAPRRASVAPGYVQELVERLYKAYRPRRTGLLGRITERGVAAARPEPRQSGEAPAGDDDPEESEPPDVTDDLKLKKPPATPTWNELDALKKGDLAAGEAPSGETSEDGKSDDDDDDGEPLARPVSVWTVNETDDFAAGRFEGTFLGSDGTVGLAPKVRSLGKPEAERLWSALPMPDGSVFVGSWSSEARVYCVTEGKTELWLETDDVGLVAMAPLPDGSLVVGGIPSGRLYRVTGAGKYTVWADLDELYIWELLPDGKGGLYAATGNHGRVYHLDAAGKATVVLQSSERHVLSLASAGNGLYAGTYPLGKVYRIDAEGVETVFETPAGAVLSLVAMPNGNLYVGEAGSGKIYLVEPDGHTREVAGAEEANTFALTLIDDSVYAATGRPGRLLRIQGDVTAQLYESDEPFLLDLAAASDSSLVGIVAGSGEVLRLGLNDSTRGVYTSPVKDAEMRARWGVLRWRSDCGAGSAVTVETRSGNTSIPDSAWSPWSPTLVESGGSAVTSPPARYIQFRAIFDGGPGLTCRLDRLDLLYRTLNRPPVLNLKSPEAGSVVSKKVEVEWEAEDPDEDELHFDVFYAPVGSDEWQKIEAADEDEEESDDEGEAATDDEEGGEEEPADSDDASDDDDAAATTTAKASGAAPWAARGSLAVHQRPAQAEAAKEAEPVKSAKEADAKEEAAPNGDDEAEAGEADEEEADKEERLVEDSITWDTSKLPDGLYRIRVLAHDEKRNPDDPKTVERISKPFRVDNSGPYLEPAAVADQAPPAELLVVEEATWLSSAEYRFDDDEWRAIVPADGIFDSRRETLRRPDLPTEAGEHSFVLRVRDAAGNLSRFEWRFTVAATEDQADE